MHDEYLRDISDLITHSTSEIFLELHILKKSKHLSIN